MRELIDHRRSREAQILACLEKGITTIPEMVEVMYTSIDRALHPAARSSVFAHIVHMVETGQIVCGGAPGERSVYAIS